jgi:methionyl-tRNA synthetase
MEGLISINDFARAHIVIGKIINADKVEKSNKLLLLKVDLGDVFGIKNIVAGIGKSYLVENLLNKRILVVANLEPATLMGVQSEGMLLAVQNDGGDIMIVEPPPEVSLGTRLK